MVVYIFICIFYVYHVHIWYTHLYGNTDIHIIHLKCCISFLDKIKFKAKNTIKMMITI